MLAGGNRTGIIMASDGLELMELVPKADFSASARVKIAKRTVIRRAQSVSGRNRAAGLVMCVHIAKRCRLCLYSAVETL